MSVVENQPIEAALNDAPEATGAGVLGPLERSDLETYEAAITRMAVEEAIVADAEPVTVTFRGRTLRLLPLDTARFNRAVAAHLCMN